MVVKEQTPAVLLKIYIEPKDGLSSGLDDQWGCLENLLRAGC